jgi:hypothetical protein
MRRVHYAVAMLSRNLCSEFRHLVLECAIPYLLFILASASFVGSLFLEIDKVSRTSLVGSCGGNVLFKASNLSIKLVNVLIGVVAVSRPSI